MAVVQVPKQLNHLEGGHFYMGIGRAVSEDWLADFSEALEYEMPRSAGLSMHYAPSVVYAGNEELWALQSGQYTPEHIRAFIGELCTDGSLDADSASRSLTVGLDSMEVDNGWKNSWRDDRLRLRLRIIDRKEPVYPSGYILTGEKKAVKETLGLQQVSKSFPWWERPKPRIPLGYIKDSSEAEISRVLLEVMDLVSKEVQLSSVDAV